MNDERYKKVLEKPEFIKDASSGALINTDNTALAAYKQQKLNVKRNAERIDNLEKDLSEIKSMLKQLLKKE